MPADKPAEDVPLSVKLPFRKQKKNRKWIILMGGVAALVLLGGGFFVYDKFFASPAFVPPPRPAQKAPVALKAGQPPPAATVPSDVANAPVKAADKAADAVAALAAAAPPPAAPTAVESPADKVAVNPPPASGPAAGATKMTSTVTAVAPGLSATTDVEAVSEASPAFRSFVANAKINGVFQGSPSRAFINGRLARAGEVVDAGLGVTFDRVDAEKKQLVFRDKTGAIVSRRY